MTAPCCIGGGPSRRLARRLSGAAASLLPGAVLLALPKCPLCLAAWLTVVTGVGVSAGAAMFVRGLMVGFSFAAVALAAAALLRLGGNRIGAMPSEPGVAQKGAQNFASACRVRNCAPVPFRPDGA